MALAAEPARKLTRLDFQEAPQSLDATSAQERVSTRLPERTADSAAALELARRIVDLAADKLASDILLLDIRGVSLIADYFVICTAASDRQSNAIVKDLEEKIREEFGRKPINADGRGDSGWVLLDYGEVIVHIFSPDRRAYYKLEELWSEATPVLRLQ